MVSKKISNISCNKECLDKAAPDYNNALKTVASTKISNSHHNLLKEENELETFLWLIHHLAPT